MDTCHSGELDKDEVESLNAADTKIGDVTFRAVGSEIALKEGFGVENTQLILEEVFTEVIGGTGATVISSAGGTEYALERDEEKNGLFTSSVLDFFELDKDGYVSELRDFVYKEVTEKSNNAQKPTARSENINNDFLVR